MALEWFSWQAGAPCPNATGWDAAPIERHAPPSCTHPGPLLFRLCCVDSPFPWYKRPPRVTILPPLSQPHAAVPWAICRRLQELQYGDQCAQRVSHAGTLNSDPPFFIALPSCGWLLVPVPIRSKKRAALPAPTRISGMRWPCCYRRVALQDLTLRADALNDLGLPVTVIW